MNPGSHRPLVQDGTKKNYALFGLAIALLFVAVAAMYLGEHAFLVRNVGILALLASVGLVRMSKVHARSDSTGAALPKRRPSRRMWLGGAVLLLATGLSAGALYYDAVHGHHAVWPVYVFAAVGFVTSGYVAALVAMLV